jgi:hypothetical protein
MKSTAAIVSLLFAAATLAAHGAEHPRIQTNESYVEELARPNAPAISDLKAVFAYVLDSLPERVKVYPTENYFYFGFYANGVRYAGNIRLEIADRDEPQLHFAYFEDTTGWNSATPGKHAVLGKADGVMVEKLEQLVYRVTYGQKSVVFELNDLSKVVPPATAIGPDEKFIGPVFDESAVRFFLLFNSKLKIFHYVLDETVKVMDEFFPLERANRILVGKRTGFAFYKDHRRDRKILIGVYEGNIRVNNYFDGPFDQLPDNFIEGESLREAILAVEPELKGKIDRLGSTPDGSVRYPIAPYAQYKKLDDLRMIDRCAASRSAAADYYACFVVEEDARGPLVPLALKKRPPKPKDAVTPPR